MLPRFARPQARFIPIALGAAAVAATAYYYSTNTTIRNDNNKVFLGNDAWIDLPIEKIEEESHDTRRFTFRLPSQDSITGLTLASALLTKFVTQKGNNVIRPYTPVSDLNAQGTFQLVIKHYEGGKMSSHLFSLKPEDTVSFKGPIKKWQWEQNSFKDITLLGAGSGITPLYQMCSHIVNDPNEKTKVKLLYGNKTPSDILLKKELDALQAKNPEKFEVVYFVDDKKDSTDSKLKTGFITKEYLSANIAKPSEDTHLFICGPPPFLKAYSGEKASVTDQGDLTGALKELGYTAEQVFKF